MTPLARYAAVATLAAVIAAGGVWNIQAWRYDGRIAAIELDAATREAALIDDVRRVEIGLNQSKDHYERETESKLEALRGDLRDAYDGRVRDIAKEYARKHARLAADSAASVEREAAAAAIGMFAVMLGELESVATVYAGEADERRIRGLNCEALYDAARAALERATGERPAR